MYSRNNNNNCTCPHCGTDSLPASEAWINGMEDGEPLLCLNCKKALRDNQTSGCLGSGKKANWNFNISFFIIVFLLSGLLIYLNRTFDVLTFKEDSGQIVYEILLILIVGSALAAGKIRQNLKYLAIWAGIFLVLMAGYSYRSDTKGSVLPRSTPLRTIISCFAVSFFGPTAPTSA